MDKIKEFMEINALFDKYGKLLTPSQQKMMEQYYCYNYSLTEIAENEDVSRNAVLDCLKKSIKKLREVEDKLHLLKNEEIIMKQIETIKHSLTIEEVEKLERMIKDGI